MIPSEILEQFGARPQVFEKGETLFREGEPAGFYYQIIWGEVRMINQIEDGSDFIQGIFGAGQSFGEPPLFGHFPYPASAIANQPSEIYRLPYHALVELLRQHFDIHQQFMATLSRRLQYKSVQMKEMSSYSAEHQLLTLLQYFKEQAGGPPAFTVPLTRQALAELTGLRVETVIRTVKQLEQAGQLAVADGKIVI